MIYLSFTMDRSIPFPCVNHQMHSAQSFLAPTQPRPPTNERQRQSPSTNPTPYTPHTKSNQPPHQIIPINQAVCSILAMTRARILSARLKSFRSAASLSAWYLVWVYVCVC